jgi:hypothetical protein
MRHLLSILCLLLIVPSMGWALGEIDTCGRIKAADTNTTIGASPCRDTFVVTASAPGSSIFDSAMKCNTSGQIDQLVAFVRDTLSTRDFRMALYATDSTIIDSAYPVSVSVTTNLKAYRVVFTPYLHATVTSGTYLKPAIKSATGSATGGWICRRTITGKRLANKTTETYATAWQSPYTNSAYLSNFVMLAGWTIRAVPVISSITVSSITTTGAIVTWTTDQSCNDSTRYGLTSGYGSIVGHTGLGTSHADTLTGLTAGATYHYQVVSKYGTGVYAQSTDATFQTLSSIVNALHNPSGTGKLHSPGGNSALHKP